VCVESRVQQKLHFGSDVNVTLSRAVGQSVLYSIARTVSPMSCGRCSDVGHGLDDPGFKTQQDQEIFLFSKTSRLAVGREVDQSPSSSPRLRMNGVIPLFYIPSSLGRGNLYLYFSCYLLHGAESFLRS
jgi:hypothetical protein